jgi:hypothetical protein
MDTTTTGPLFGRPTKCGHIDISAGCRACARRARDRERRADGLAFLRLSREECRELLPILRPLVIMGTAPKVATRIVAIVAQ